MSTSVLERPGLVDGGVLDRTDVRPVEPGDHDRFAHYVKRNEILPSAFTGAPVEALCGKVWVPSRDPERFTVCPTCKEIYQSIPLPSAGDGEPGLTGEQ